MLKGWVKIHRSLCDSPLWLSETFSRGQAWGDLILLANHKDGFIRARGVRVEVKRGQVGYSQVTLSKRWQWSRGKTKRFLDELEMDQQIVQQKNNVTSLISIVNYEEYQGGGTANGTANGQQTVQQTVSKRYTNKNEKNEKNEIKPTQNEFALDSDNKDDEVTFLSFDDFWNVYANKKDVKKCMEKYSKIKENDRQLIKERLPLYIETTTTDKSGNLKFRKNPLTWLNGECWNDEIEQTKPIDRPQGLQR